MFAALPTTHDRIQAEKHMHRMYIATKVFTLATLVMLVATAVLIGLAQARYMDVTSALYAFSGFIGAFAVTAILDCTLRAFGRKHRIDVDAFFQKEQPMPPPKPPKKKATT